jgi:hypothetical protein
VENNRGTELFLRICNGSLQFGRWLGANTGNVNILVQTTVEAGRKYDAVGTYDSEYWRLYLDGVLVASLYDPGRDIGVYENFNGETFNPVWLLGGHGDPNQRCQFVGTIYNAEVYDTALTSEQVSEVCGPIAKLTGPTASTV